MEELDLKELLQVFWEKRMQIVIIIAIFVVIGIIYTIGFVEPKYESSTTLLLATNSSSSQPGSESITTTDVTLNSKLVSTYSTLIKSSKVIRNVISNLALTDIDEGSIKKNVSVTQVSDTEVIQITVRNDDPVLAQKIANEIAKVFIEKVKEEFYKIENIRIVDEAEIAQSPYNINHTKDVIIFGAVGLVIALMYVLVANMLDTTIKSAQDIEKATGFTVLATIPLYDMNEDRSKLKKRKGGKR